jgi:hypothetical protein
MTFSFTKEYLTKYIKLFNNFDLVLQKECIELLNNNLENEIVRTRLQDYIKKYFGENLKDLNERVILENMVTNCIENTTLLLKLQLAKAEERLELLIDFRIPYNVIDPENGRVVITEKNSIIVFYKNMPHLFDFNINKMDESFYLVHSNGKQTVGAVDLDRSNSQYIDEETIISIIDKEIRYNIVGEYEYGNTYLTMNKSINTRYKLMNRDIFSDVGQMKKAILEFYSDVLPQTILSVSGTKLFDKWKDKDKAEQEVMDYIKTVYGFPLFYDWMKKLKDTNIQGLHKVTIDHEIYIVNKMFESLIREIVEVANSELGIDIDNILSENLYYLFMFNIFKDYRFTFYDIRKLILTLT